jgi:hypothetical protein
VTATAVLLTTGAVALVSLAPAAEAATTPRATITRTEVIARAQDWYNRRADLSYDSSRAGGTLITDVDGVNRYGADCSGFVSMAWRLSPGTAGGLNTAGLARPSVTTRIDGTDLLPGDILDYPGQHVVLFDRWESDHVHFSYYSFGSTPIKHVFHATLDGGDRRTPGRLSGWPVADYLPLRYNRIADGKPGHGTRKAPPPPVIVVTGYTRGDDRHLWQGVTVDGVPATWAMGGPEVSGDPVAVIGAGGAALVFARGTDDKLWEWTVQNGVWVSQALTDATFVGQPAVTVNTADGAPAVFGRTIADRLVEWVQVAGVWGSAVLDGPPMASDPVTAPQYTGQPVVSTRADDGTLAEYRFGDFPTASARAT